MTARDPYAHLKERAWREVADMDVQLERGEIDEQAWHDAMSAMVTPAYLAAETPWEGSGKSGTAEDWEYSRSHIAHAIDKSGSFLDIGCANGYMLECLARWTPFALDLYGLDISAPLVERARQRLPQLADHLFVGNALAWQSERHFDFVRMNFEYVPARRRRQLFENLLAQAGRVVVGVFNEHFDERTIEAMVKGWGYRIAGKSERANQHKAEMDYCVLWVDSEERS